MNWHYENICCNTEQSGSRKKERKNLNHASDMADEQVIKTSVEKMYFTQPDEETLLDQPVYEKEEFESNGHIPKRQKDSGSSITIISTEMWIKMGSQSLASHAQLLEDYDGQLMRHEVSLDCKKHGKDASTQSELVLLNLRNVSA